MYSYKREELRFFNHQGALQHIQGIIQTSHASSIALFQRAFPTLFRIRQSTFQRPAIIARAGLFRSVAATTRTMGRGAFIVFEGVDRSGKSTQSLRLVQTLQASGVRPSHIKRAAHDLKIQKPPLTLVQRVCVQANAELWRFPDRSTATGQMIDAYLQSKSDLDDAAVHLLFSANRWEKRYLPDQSSPRTRI